MILYKTVLDFTQASRKISAYVVATHRTASNSTHRLHTQKVNSTEIHTPDYNVRNVTQEKQVAKLAAKFE